MEIRPKMPICRCSNDTETIAHVLACPDPLATEHHNMLLKKCLADLKIEGHTSPGIITCWEPQIRYQLGLPTKSSPPPMYKSTKLENAAKLHQNPSGWDLFLKGIISSKWIQAQQIHLKLFPPQNSKKKHGWEHLRKSTIISLGYGDGEMISFMVKL